MWLAARIFVDNTLLWLHYAIPSSPCKRFEAISYAHSTEHITEEQSTVHTELTTIEFKEKLGVMHVTHVSEELYLSTYTR